MDASVTLVIEEPFFNTVRHGCGDESDGRITMRYEEIERRTSELATLKDLREAVERTQEDLAARLGVGQDTVSCIERRSDILLSTLRRYVEAMGGELELLARFPNRARPNVAKRAMTNATPAPMTPDSKKPQTTSRAVTYAA